MVKDVSVGGLNTGVNNLGSIIYEEYFKSRQFDRTSQPRQWFALRVKSNFERTTALHLRERGYQEFLPTYTIRSRWSDRVKSVEKPLFPGYVFCNFSSQVRLPILTTPGVLHVVGVGKEPAPVDNQEMEAVLATLQSGLLLRPWPFLQVGEKVVVERGPLTGIEGIVTHFKGAYRLVLSISLLQRSIAAEIEREWIRPRSRGAAHENRSSDSTAVRRSVAS